jgi:hypothetical protein
MLGSCGAQGSKRGRPVDLEDGSSGWTGNWGPAVEVGLDLIQENGRSDGPGTRDRTRGPIGPSRLQLSFTGGMSQVPTVLIMAFTCRWHI